MAQCPHCGTAVNEQALQCQNCGAALGAQQGQQAQQPHDSHGGQQHPQGGQQRPQGGQQPPQGQRQAQQPPGQPGGGPGRGGHGGGGPGGKSRREFLMYGGGAAAIAVGGYFAYDTFLGGPGGPEGAVRSFWDALDNGNLEEADSYIHPDSPAKGQLMEGSGGMGQSMLESADVSVSSAEVTNEEGDTATVEATIEMSIMGESDTQTQTYELRKHNGDWKIYSGASI